MKTKIYLVKNYMRFNNDETPTRQMRKKATPTWATVTREEAAQDVRNFVKHDKEYACDLYKRYWFIQEIELYRDLSNY